jgi:hypothetical protein
MAKVTEDGTFLSQKLLFGELQGGRFFGKKSSHESRDELLKLFIKVSSLVHISRMKHAEIPIQPLPCPCYGMKAAVSVPSI